MSEASSAKVPNCATIRLRVLFPRAEPAGHASLKLQVVVIGGSPLRVLDRLRSVDVRVKSRMFESGMPVAISFRYVLCPVAGKRQAKHQQENKSDSL